MQEYKTAQEAFWANEFGNDYIGRNQGDQLLASNLHFFSKALQRAGKVASCLEFGANIGMNLKALRLLYPTIQLTGIEINEQAATALKEIIGDNNVFHGSIFDSNYTQQAELSLIKGVLIHINPEMLPVVYEKLYQASTKYILVAEYYNPQPVALNYRGHEERLFKRDFAGELLEKYSDLQLVDYGFAYRKDPAFPQDDITWFLLEKK
jgi:pseudaminic acid biosynthesis-associated methylase